MPSAAVPYVCSTAGSSPAIGVKMSEYGSLPELAISAKRSGTLIFGMILL